MHEIFFTLRDSAKHNHDMRFPLPNAEMDGGTFAQVKLKVYTSI